MTLNPFCTACRHVLRQQSGQLGHSRHVHSNLRHFSTSRFLSASQAVPKEYMPKSTPPQSLTEDKTNGVASEGVQPNTLDTAPTSRTLAKEFRKRATNFTETYYAYGVCDRFVKECARQADYTIPQAREKNVEVPKTKDQEDLGVGTGWWYETLGLTPTFNNWAQVTFLHMYLLNCRIRCFPPAHAPVWHQHLLDHFFYNAEDRMVLVHNVAARSIRNKYLKDLYTQWRGLIAAYDEGLMRGDASLATAVWRNVFKASADVDFRGVGDIVSYMRGTLNRLEAMTDEDFAEWEVAFGDPAGERDGVLSRSRLMIEGRLQQEVKERQR